MLPSTKLRYLQKSLISWPNSLFVTHLLFIYYFHSHNQLLLMDISSQLYVKKIITWTLKGLLNFHSLQSCLNISMILSISIYISKSMYILQFRTEHRLATCRYDEKFNGFVEHRLNYLLLYYNMSFPGSSAGKETACNAGDPGSIPGLERFPWGRDRLPTPVFLGFPGGSDSKETACNVGDLGLIPGWEYPLGKRIATHSSTLT